MQQWYFITIRREKQGLFSDSQNLLDIRLEGRLFGLGSGKISGLHHVVDLQLGLGAGGADDDAVLPQGVGQDVGRGHLHAAHLGAGDRKSVV